MAQTIKRKRESRQTDYPQGRFWLRFIDSNGRHLFTVDPWTCPAGVQAKPHWHENPDPDAEPVLNEITGEEVVLGVCQHVLDGEAPADPRKPLRRSRSDAALRKAVVESVMEIARGGA